MGKHIILAGGGHAHLTVLLNCHVFKEKGHALTLISPSPYHYYSGMGPGMLSGIYKPQETRFNIKKMVEKGQGRFIQDRVVRLDPGKKRVFLHYGGPVEYDVISFNIGSNVPSDIVEGTWENVFSVKPIDNLLKGREAVIGWPDDEPVKILVAGGGPAGVEISGNLWKLIKGRNTKKEITVAAGKKLLRRYPEKVRHIVEESFRRRGINVIEGAYVKKISDGVAVLDDGSKLLYDFVFLAPGTKPPSLFLDSGIATDKDGGMLVNHYLQSISYPEIFGGGDCIGLQGRTIERVGVYAVRENPVLYHNLLAFMQEEEMRTFAPGNRYLLIFNLGDGRAVFWRGSWVWDGRLALFLKYYIDYKFMHRFQVSGERKEI